MYGGGGGSALVVIVPGQKCMKRIVQMVYGYKQRTVMLPEAGFLRVIENPENLENLENLLIFVEVMEKSWNLLLGS